jgi:hypothetical protein
MPVRQDFALLGDRRPGRESDLPTSAGDGLGSWVRKTTGGYSWLARWSSWLLETEIGVSRMSDSWMRTHAREWDKRGWQ